MDAFLHDDDSFDNFGRDALMPYSGHSAEFVEAKTKRWLKHAAAKSLPNSPGIYGFVDAKGHLIYVGKSKSLRSRVLSYFMPNHKHEKAGYITAHARRVVWETQPSEFAALIREQKLICRWQPRFNVVGMPKTLRAGYLCLGKSPATFYLATKRDPNAIACEGPFFGTTRLNRVIEVFNRIFKLRDCKDRVGFKFGDQLTLFDDPKRAGCLRAELQTCLGPCAAFCSKSAYENQASHAASFLMKPDEQIVDDLEQSMHRAAKQLQFEQAARYREDWQVMRWITRKLLDNEQARTSFHFIYPVAGADGRDIWYLIRSGKVEHAVARPTTAAAWVRCREEIIRWTLSSQKFSVQYDGGANTLHIVAAWFRQHRSELKQTKSLENVPTKFADAIEHFDAKPLQVAV
jgi:excinuclease ABC subunit C